MQANIVVRRISSLTGPEASKTALVLNRFWVRIILANNMTQTYPDIVEPDFIAAFHKCKSATMTSVERLYSLCKAVDYVVEAGIQGNFVECGVWKGGSVMMIAETLLARRVTDRDIYLFDTFAGMTAPSDADEDFSGAKASDLLARGDRDANLSWAYAAMDEVRANLMQTAYPIDAFKLVQGNVLETIPAAAPERIALLRLDTDWYESTRHELECLFDRVEPRGVVIIDDYGHYKGCRQAADEFFANYGTKFFMHRIDYTGRLIVKA